MTEGSSTQARCRTRAVFVALLFPAFLDPNNVTGAPPGQHLR